MRLLSALLLPIAAACSASPPSPPVLTPPALTPALAAEFRGDAEQALDSLEPLCWITRVPDELRRYDPARARMKAIEQGVTGTPLAAIIVELRRARAGREADCNMPSGAGPETHATVTSDIGHLSRALGRMEQIASPFIEAKGKP